MNCHRQRGLTLLEVVVVLVALGVLSSIAVRSLLGPKETVELQVINEQALDLVNFAERIRLTPTSITPANITSPSSGAYSRTYMSVPLGITVEDFRAAIVDQHGFVPKILPSSTPLDTPYLIYMTDEQVYVETTIPGDDVELTRATVTVAGNQTTLRFYPTVDSDGSGTSRAASSRYTQSFMTETVR